MSENCHGLDMNRVRRLMEIEMQGGLGQTRGPAKIRILLSCRPGRVVVSVEDPITGKQVRRPVPGLRMDEPGHERVLALSASQLLLASWMELLTPRFAKSSAADTPEAKAARRLAVRTVRHTVALPQTRKMSLGLSANGGVADLAHPFPVMGGKMWVGFDLSPSWRLSARITMQGGRAKRDSGFVRVLLAGADLSATWTWLKRGHFSMITSLAMGGHYLSLTGLPASSEYTGTTFGHVVGSTGLTLGPRFRLGRFRLGLDITASLIFPWVSGLVVGEPSVRPYGAWLGGNLVAEILF